MLGALLEINGGRAHLDHDAKAVFSSRCGEVRYVVRNPCVGKTKNKSSTGKGHSQIPCNKHRSFQAGVWCNRARSHVLHREFMLPFGESVPRSAPWPTARTP